MDEIEINHELPEKKPWLRGLRLLWVIAAGVAVGLLWLIEIQFFMCHPHWQLLLRELAFALIISSVFGLTIEQIQRKEFVDLVNKERRDLQQDVFLYAYGSNLPEQIRQEIRSSILTKPFYRRDLGIDWEFSLFKDSVELMEVQKHYSYTVVNNSLAPTDWLFAFIQTGADDLK